MEPQTGLISDLSEDGERVFRYLRVLLFCPDLQDLLQFLLVVLSGRDDDGSVQQVQRQPMGTGVLGATDLGDTLREKNYFDPIKDKYFEGQMRSWHSVT